MNDETQQAAIAQQAAETKPLDPKAPLFFFSYAHAADNLRTHSPRRKPSRRMLKFFDDLSENVAELVSRPTGSDPGYIDRSIKTGVLWSNELLDAVGTCQVFIALLCQPYFSSLWCSWEWYAFSQRSVVNLDGDRSNHQTSIIPVIWAAPMPMDRMPRVVSGIQRFTPNSLPDDFAARYTEEGILGLLQTRVEAYQAVTWRLAQLIAELVTSHWVEPRQLHEEELRDVFREQEE